MKRSISVLLFLIPALSSAGQSDGTIKMIQSGPGHTAENVYVLVEMNSIHDNKPGCATEDRFALNPAIQPGKTQLPILMAAHAANKQVYISGSGSCSVINGYESIDYIKVF